MNQPWHIVYVKSRAEKRVADRFRDAGFETFCPLQTIIRQWSDRKKKVTIPYFNSYVFVRFETERQLEVLQTPGVVRFVYYLHRPAQIRETEMIEVMAFFEKHQDVACAAYQLGQAVKITQGALHDRQGVLVRQTKDKVVLEIKELGFICTVAKKAIVAA